jgi:hypothetical protein
MADLIFAFGLGVFAANNPLSRHFIWTALPLLGAATVLAKSTCKRWTRAVVTTTTSFEPSTPAVLPKIKRPGPKHETIAQVTSSPSVV